jgi:hypothetical protein
MMERVENSNTRRVSEYLEKFRQLKKKLFVRQRFPRGKHCVTVYHRDITHFPIVPRNVTCHLVV